jgi:hypothetical protein
VSGLAGRVENLPKWAQKELEALQRQASELRRDNDRLRAAFAGNGTSPFKIERGMREEALPLPDGTNRVSWEAPDGFELVLYTEDGDLKVMCSSWHGVALRPEASNVIRVGRGRTR